jgi:uncharacterized protein (DUF1778 family)
MYSVHTERKMAQAQFAEQEPRRRTTHSNKPRRKQSASVINLRADETTRALIDRAANVLGQNRTEFMLASARAHAQEVILSQVYFTLGDDDWKASNAALKAPPPSNAALKSLMSRKPLWNE